MKEFINLHISLFKYLRIELKKKRTLSKLVHFFYDTSKMYKKALLQVYRNAWLIFDKTYQIQKADYDKKQKLLEDCRRALRLLQYIDTKMAKAGVNRKSRRQFWRDFQRDGKLRTEEFEKLMKEIS